jgi:hypothetical protein
MEIGFLCDFSSYGHSCSSNSFGHRNVETVNWIFGPISWTQRSPLLSKQRHAPVGPEGWQPAVRIPEAIESDVLNKGNTIFLATYLVYSVPVKGIKHEYCGSLASHFRSRHVPSLPTVRRVEQKYCSLICSLFSDTFSNLLDYVAPNGWMISSNELKRMWKETSVTLFKALLWHLHGGTAASEKTFRHDNWCPGRNSNQARTKH